MQLSIDGTPNVAIVVAKRVPGGEVMQSAELKMAAIVDEILRPDRQTSTVWISTTVNVCFGVLINTCK